MGLLWLPERLLLDSCVLSGRPGSVNWAFVDAAAVAVHNLVVVTGAVIHGRRLVILNFLAPDDLDGVERDFVDREARLAASRVAFWLAGHCRAADGVEVPVDHE